MDLIVASNSFFKANSSYPYHISNKEGDFTKNHIDKPTSQMSDALASELIKWYKEQRRIKWNSTKIYQCKEPLYYDLHVAAACFKKQMPEMYSAAMEATKERDISRLTAIFNKIKSVNKDDIKLLLTLFEILLALQQLCQ